MMNKVPPFTEEDSRWFMANMTKFNKQLIKHGYVIIHFPSGKIYKLTQLG
tara:strand:+ start:1261 stop:1410 length:150 start_codon:yes stop_codon:yes gene_type:complete